MDFLEKFDKQKLQRITLTVIAALTLIALLLLLAIIVLSVEGNSGRGGIFGNDDIDIEFEDLTVDDSHLSKGSLLLINNDHKYTIPGDLNLILISEYRDANSSDIPYSVLEKYHYKLDAVATEYAHKMLCDMGKSTGNDDIMITSAFRSYDDQMVSSASTAAGHSDHHSGMLICIKGSNGALAEENLAWLEKNADKYGFVIRYPEDKAEITGVSDYTQAYRYVGVAHAKYMKDNNLCLEEYVEYLKDSTSYSEPLSITVDDDSVYYVYYAEASSGDEIKVPVKTANPDGSMNFDYTISGTNDGGVVVTVKVK